MFRDLFAGFGIVLVLVALSLILSVVILNVCMGSSFCG